MTTETRLHRAAGPMTLAEATRRLLRRDAFDPTTRDVYVVLAVRAAAADLPVRWDQAVRPY